MPETLVFEGRCFCGAIEIAVTGQPGVAGICHCESCRKWHSAPINAWALWPDSAVTVTRGQEEIVEFNQQGAGGPSGRSSCRRCGGALFNRKLQFGMTVVYAMTLDGSDFVFKPTFHCFYGEGVVDLADGLPKYEDLPESLGGSGKQLPEPSATEYKG